jgi:hypothetical protein
MIKKCQIMTRRPEWMKNQENIQFLDFSEKYGKFSNNRKMIKNGQQRTKRAKIDEKSKK